VGTASAHAIAAFFWRITRHNTLAALADLYPQWLIRDLLPLPPSGGIPREATRSLSPPSSASLRAKAAGRSLRRSRSPSRPRWSRAWIQQQEITMAQIGTFTRAEDGSYSGTIKTLSLNIKARLVPADASSNDKAPDLRVLVGNVEIGAAWRRTSKENTEYHSVKLDDPSFPAPIYANLFKGETDYTLVWSR
jgi:uncharacterized protein (DUF736 family)